ncbi:MAG: Y-family DNA polymerase [Candidatus Puniceispirillaceae bacterium]
MTMPTSSFAQNHQLKAGREARFIYIYLPNLPLARLYKHHQLDSEAPLALYQAVKGADRLVYCNQAAMSFGLAADMNLSDARALVPLCRFLPAEPEKDREWLLLLGQFCWRYSPVVGVDPDDLGLWIDATGATHLWGGTSQMLDDITSCFAEHNLQAHSVMASYYGAAKALAIATMPITALIIPADKTAHYDAVLPLPVTALRLAPDICDALAQIGMLFIKDIMDIKRDMLAMRFGEQIILRRDQILGIVPERPVPLPLLQPVLIQQHYHDPVCGLASLETMVDGLLCGLADLLSDMKLACRSVEIGWQTVDKQISHSANLQICHHLSRPSRDIAQFRRLFAEAATQIDAGFGIEYGWVKAAALSPSLATALSFDDNGKIIEDDGDAISQLVDHLVARLGADKVKTLQAVENWIPEESECYVPAQSAYQDDRDIGLFDHAIANSQSTSPRPMRLLHPPEPISAIALLPDHPPSQIRWHGKSWRIRRATGPERIGPRWWQAGQAMPAHTMESRDYYRLETQSGQRLWVYRQGLPERGEAVSWFLHGFFA